MKVEKDWNKYFDDLQQVVFHLRHSCVGIKSAKKAVKLIQDKTDLTKERIEEIIKESLCDKFQK